MASDLDTVRVLRALFHDMPRAPQGLTPEESLAWTRRAMAEFEGGDMAYTLEHVTRNAMLDLILRLREDGYLQEDAAFDKMLVQVSTDTGRRAFRDWCINAQKSADATARLLNRARPAVCGRGAANWALCGAMAQRPWPLVCRIQLAR